MRSDAWAWRSATSTAASSTACAPNAARSAPAATAAPAPACRATRRSKRRSPCSPASSRRPRRHRQRRLRLPDFNGTVRVMAVAWSADKLGHGQKDVIVRDAVALTASAPRFLTLGDEARLDIAVHNVEGPQAAYKLELINGDDTIRRTRQASTCKAGERRSDTSRQARRRRPRRLRHPRHRPRRHRRQAPPDVRREAAGWRHQAHDGRVAEGGRQHLAQPRPGRDMIAARTTRLDQRRPDGNARHPRAAHLARPLPLRLRRADGQPRAAAGLRQCRRRAARHRARTRS